MRSLARIIGVSAPFLSRVLSGKSKLSFARANEIAIKIKFSRNERSMFLRSVAVYSTRGPARQILIDTIDELASGESPFRHYEKLSEEKRMGLFQVWYLPAILDLTTCTNFKSDVAWIASRLKISRAESSQAVDQLETMGLLDRSTAKWRKVGETLYCPTDEPQEFVRNFHAAMSRKAVDVLTKETSKKEFQNRSITSMSMAIDPELMATATKMIERFQHRLADTLTLGNCTEVYHLNVQLFPLTTSQSS